MEMTKKEHKEHYIGISPIAPREDRIIEMIGNLRNNAHNAHHVYNRGVKKNGYLCKVEKAFNRDRSPGVQRSGEKYPLVCRIGFVEC